MSNYTATVEWHRRDEKFTDNRYSRLHRWRFDGGVDIPASSSPHVVRVPYSDPAGVDPEEALIAALSSCHMLTFLYLAARKGWIVDSYVDEAVGVLEKIGPGKMAVTRVTLRPLIRYADGRSPSTEELDALHHAAHEECYIANSVKTQIVVEARFV